MKTETNRITQTPEDVLNELRSLVSEAEQILERGQARACSCDGRLAALRDRLESAQARAVELFRGGKQKVMTVARRADGTVRENPYQSIAVALGAGLLAGVLIGRRGKTPPQ